jgi:hypothetical protein
MLGGLDPVIIFQFGKIVPTATTTVSRIPLVAEAKTFIDFPPIPIYLSEEITGLFIDTEDKTVDIETDTDTNTAGTSPDVTQKGIASTIAISLTAKKDSIGMILLSSMIDVLFDKATSQEYTITYLHGATTIFRGVLHNYSVNQVADNDKLSIKIELSRGGKNPQKDAPPPTVPKSTGVRPSIAT